MNRVILQIALPVDGDGAPPWVQLLPAGTFSGADGRGPWHVKDAKALIAASLPAGGRLTIDENHSTDLAAPRGEPAPACGWIVELQERADGIWGRVEWNESGRALLADKSYFGISPVFGTDRTGNVVQLIRAALTNNPNLTQLATLQHQETSMDLVRMRTLLGLPADADQAAIDTAIEAAVIERTAQAARLTELQTQLAAAAKPDVVTALQTQLATLTTQLASLQQEGRRAKAVAVVDKAINEGRVSVGVLRDHYIAQHMADPASVELVLSKLPSLHQGGVGDRTLQLNDAMDGDGLTETESKLCAATGTDPKKFAEFKKSKRKAA